MAKARRGYQGLSVAEIQRRYLPEGSEPSPYILSLMRRDGRRGVQRVYRILQKRETAGKEERHRLKRLQQLENKLSQGGRLTVAGVDEAGVGPLAGPVVAAAVIFKPGVEIIGLDDSKKLDPETRRVLSREIRDKAECYARGIAEVDEINRINVYQASLKAMGRAVSTLAVKPDHLLIDARRLPDLEIAQDAVIGGDRRHFSIAAASILAKTFRDRLMKRLDREHPGYGLARHKGYSTPEHQEAIRRLGPCPIHRTSCAFLDELSGAYSRQFYRLKAQVQAVVCSEDLLLCRRRMARLKSVLAGPEIHKLRLLIGRKLKRYPPALQLDLLRGI